ncbi:ROK family protein [Vagococcus xieshaowenii]|uniref:Fructokinase n=1 Tax=Vagococcus xieshaowenii TaxID=2562451 RepID=A0AAJ5JLP2_9ENTE|nr:ROK family protein [Vagococcus xieshaowenii]QCA28517.1 ROK family protein [Vagococcus xieshaowenii]TFZ42730.1 ROK family protein [Vagococcus xieshaowenii]
MYGAIEAGGTKFVCAVSNEALEVVERVSIPTETPEVTMQAVYNFFDQYELVSMGVGSFGPIDVNEASATYGYITSTPKLKWQHVNVLGMLKEHYDIPISWTTDVNAAAYGELTFGAAKGKQSCVYLTIGTGVGGGAVVNGQLLQGFGHPEMGHIHIKRLENDAFEGVCPFHNDCVEGLVAGPALEKRTGKKGIEVKANDEVWQIQAHYIAQALMNYTLILSPEIIILGGGVMHQKQLFPLIRQEFQKIVAEYVAYPDLDLYIVPTKLGDDSGIMGCLQLAKEVAGK